MKLNEVYKIITPVDIVPVLVVLPTLQFVDICVGSTDPNKPPCSVVPPRASMPPVVTHLVQSLGLGGITQRLFLRRLGPRQGILPHVDAWIPVESRIRRFHIPLISHPDIVMRWPDDGVEVHLQPGFLYEVRYNRMHEVVNPTSVSRTHIQIDQQDATIE